MKIYVGSVNPVKVEAVLAAAKPSWPTVEVSGFAVASDVVAQPMSDQDTKQGAINRAQQVLKLAKQQGINESFLGIGIEGGVFLDTHMQMWSTVWAVVIDLKTNFYFSNGARFLVPAVIAKKIIMGEEMGFTVAKLAKIRNLKQKQGMIGVITQGFVTRTAEYTSIVKIALGLYYGRHWQDKL